MRGSSLAFPERIAQLMIAPAFQRDGQRRLQLVTGANLYRESGSTEVDAKGRRTVSGVTSTGQPFTLTELTGCWLLKATGDVAERAA